MVVGFTQEILQDLIFIKKKLKYIEENNKKLIVFATGASKAGKKADPEAIEFQRMLFSHFERVDKKWTEQITDFVKSM